MMEGIKVCSVEMALWLCSFLRPEALVFNGKYLGFVL